MARRVRCDRIDAASLQAVCVAVLTPQHLVSVIGDDVGTPVRVEPFPARR